MEHAMVVVSPLRRSVGGQLLELKTLMVGHREVVPARTSPTLHPHPLPLCCTYPV